MVCCVYRGDADDYKGRDDYDPAAAAAAAGYDYDDDVKDVDRYSPRYGPGAGQYVMGASKRSDSDTFV